MCKRFFVSKDRLAQAAEVIITQNRLEAKVKLWQGKFCSPTHSAIPVAPGAHRSILLGMRILHWNFHLYFQFERKCTNKLLPMGHVWQQATLCQLSLKTIHITAPKISFKITIFCVHIAGHQLQMCHWVIGPVTTANLPHCFSTRTAESPGAWVWSAIRQLTPGDMVWVLGIYFVVIWTNKEMYSSISILR